MTAQQRTSAELSRRDLIAVILGATAASLPGCSAAVSNIAGELLSPDHSAGHRLRDGFRPNVSVDNQQQCDVVIVGGGIAGLSAAWRLKNAGFDDFVLLELEPIAGGTSRSGDQGAMRFPWAAHYLTMPMKENVELVRLLREMQVVVGVNDDGQPIVAEQYLCREPEQRVYVNGQWIEGLYPGLGASQQDIVELQQFRDSVRTWALRRDANGRRMFAIPIADGSDCEEVKQLDQISMADWMDRKGWTSERLRWVADYSCRDDYGLSASQTSAWAGIFYFASRIRSDDGESQPVITWPEGNGRIVDYLASCVSDSIRHSQAVCEIDCSQVRPIVTAFDTNNDKGLRISAQRVIFAAPQFVASHVIRDFKPSRPSVKDDFHYGAWIVANVHLRDRPAESGFPLSWDNVAYQSKSLGYVTSTHQAGIDYGPTVLTWYYPFVDNDNRVTRRQLMTLKWHDWAELVVADLESMHRDIAAKIERIDIMLWGHAMIQPRVGFVWSASRRSATKSYRTVHFANTDLSGVALFEEAFYHGIRAADEVLADLS